jgi:hypothetical protein
MSETCPCCLGTNGHHFPQLCPVDWEGRFRELFELTLRDVGLDGALVAQAADRFLARLRGLTTR